MKIETDESTRFAEITSMSELAVAVEAALQAANGQAMSLQELSQATSSRIADTAIVAARLTIAGIIHHRGLGSGYWIP